MTQQELIALNESRLADALKGRALLGEQQTPGYAGQIELIQETLRVLRGEDPEKV